MQPHQNQDQPRPRPAAAAVTSAGGIGSAFLHPAPSSPQPPSPAVPSPPLINNHFTGAPSPEARGISNGNEINVDNIFASMIEDDSGAAAHHSSANSNNIFHNFATMNDRAAANSSSGPVNYDMPAAPSPATSVIPLRKYSDSTNYRSKNGMIGAADSASHYVAAPASPTAAAAGAAALGNHFISRSGSGGLSKSVGRASFMRQGTRTLSARYVVPCYCRIVVASFWMFFVVNCVETLACMSIDAKWNLLFHRCRMCPCCVHSNSTILFSLHSLKCLAHTCCINSNYFNLTAKTIHPQTYVMLAIFSSGRIFHT